MELSTEEALTIIGLIFAAFAFCMNKAIKLTKDIVTLTERYDVLEASKFSLDERVNKMENKITELDKNFEVMTVHLGSIKSGMDRLEKISSKIFDMLDKKQDKVRA